MFSNYCFFGFFLLSFKIQLAEEKIKSALFAFKNVMKWPCVAGRKGPKCRLVGKTQKTALFAE